MTHHAFWTFSLDRYHRPGVPDLCLELQDSFGADVNLVLFALWMGHDGYVLDHRGAKAAINAVSQWHLSVVKPMRRARRWLKGRDIADTDARDTLRAAIQKWEIEAERMEQQMLFDLVSGPDVLRMQAQDRGTSLMAENAMQVCIGAPRATIDRLALLCL
jgi:uncharacterized protein (TIGR02444 family)